MDDKVFQPSKRTVDIPTLLIIMISALGPVALVYLHNSGEISAFVSVILGTLFMNLSFTAWHEPSHGNFSKYKWVNNIAGFIASLASVYPGYFKRRREHLAHHKWEGVSDKDPVYARIQNTSFLHFPLRLIKVNFLERPKLDIPDNFCRYTRSQAISDHISNFMVILCLVILAVYGLFYQALCAWIIPRILVFGIHAYYICFFPHYESNGGFNIYRSRDGGGLLRFFTVEQNYHGIHHKWPFIPWYKYRKAYKDILEKNE